MPLIKSPAAQDFTLSCEASGHIASFRAVPSAEGILAALQGLPVPARFGLSESVMQCMAWHMAAEGSPACYGGTLTLTAGLPRELA